MDPHSQSLPEPSPVRFGVLGTGRITRRLVAELQQTEGVEVVAIASRDGARARWYADQFGVPHACQGYESLMRNPEVDAVYVALPPSMHTEWACAAAEAGKHVLCEKPLASTSAEAQRFDRACTEANVYWLDATGWLHHPRTAAMGSEITSGALGQLRHVTASVSFFQPFQSGDHRLVPELGGGCLLDLGWYAMGAAVWAVGGHAPVAVSAIGQQSAGIWSRVSAVCEFVHGVTASVHCAYDVATRKWVEIAGDAASVVCDDFTRPWPEKPPRYWVHDRAGAVRSQSVEGLQERRMILALIEEIRGERNLGPMRQQALATQCALDAVASALATGERVERVDQERVG